MEITAIITANMLFLVLVAFAVRLERRVLRAEERSRRDVSRLTERVQSVSRAVQVLELGAVPPEASQQSEAERNAERQLVEAIGEIMSYRAPGAETEADK
jgi:hypothetical protein